jgi:hypothetical protein
MGRNVEQAPPQPPDICGSVGLHSAEPQAEEGTECPVSSPVGIRERTKTACHKRAGAPSGLAVGPSPQKMADRRIFPPACANSDLSANTEKPTVQ